MNRSTWEIQLLRATGYAHAQRVWLRTSDINGTNEEKSK